MYTIKVAIADDHEIFIDGIEVLLKKAAGIQVIGTAVNGRDLVELVRTHQPDVVLTDIKMPLVDGIEATKQILKIRPETGIIALSMFDEESLITEMLDAGAMGYLLKNACKKEIINAIEAVSQGLNYYCQRTNTKLIKLIAASHYNPRRKKEKEILSPREIEIVKLICRQYTNKDIAEKLNISVRTVEGHRTHIEEKINAKGTAGIVIYGIKSGIHVI